MRAPAYLKANGMPVQPTDIEQHHRTVEYHSPRFSTPNGLVFCRGEERFEFAGKPALIVTDVTAVVHGAIAGIGIAQTGEFIARPYIESGALVELLPEWTRPARAVHLIRPASRYPSLKFRVFSDWLATIFAPYDVSASSTRLSMSVDSHSKPAVFRDEQSAGSLATV